MKTTSNIKPTDLQNQRATEDFIRRSKPYFNMLEAIFNNKRLCFIYDISTNTFSTEKMQDTQPEIELKNRISELRESIMNNILNY